MGLHKRYRSLLTGISAESELPDTQQLEEAFVAMMRRLRTQHALLPEFLLEREVQRFIEEHANILNAAFDKVTMSDLMRQRLRESDYVFSGMKTFHELKEAFPLLTDEEGNMKPFHTFLNDVQKIDKTYNKDYLRSEYNFVRASSQMAGKWETFVEDGDEYNLQYRTARDHKVRPEHAAMHGITLPYSDSFWNEFFPPNGWNCRCTVVQVLKDKYPVTDHNTAIQLGREALKSDKKGMFRFNSGKQQKAVPDYNPYTIRKCNTCPLAKGKEISNTASIPNNELCKACALLRHYTPILKKRALKGAKRLLIKTDKLKTGVFYRTKGSLKRGLSHAYLSSEIYMHLKIHEYLKDFKFIRKSPLGEVKDLKDPKDIRNLQKKKKRGVTGYNMYEVTIDGNAWCLKTEIYKDESECIYILYKKKE